jgi:hypothetical protein
MKKVYKHKPLALDEYLGRVDEDGKVYKNVAGPRKLDSYIGRVDLTTGKVYDAGTTPERYLGRVDPEGKVFLSALGAEEYLGKVHANGKMFHHKRLARDEYLGKVKDMGAVVFGGAAFLLLAMPVFQAELEKAEGEKAAKTQK